MTNRFKIRKGDDSSSPPKTGNKVSINITKTGSRFGKSAKQTEVEVEPNLQKVRLSADIERGLHKKLKMYATLTERSIVEIIEEWITNQFTSELLETLTLTDNMRLTESSPQSS